MYIRARYVMLRKGIENNPKALHELPECLNVATPGNGNAPVHNGADGQRGRPTKLAVRESENGSHVIVLTDGQPCFPTHSAPNTVKDESGTAPVGKRWRATPLQPSLPDVALSRMAISVKRRMISAFERTYCAKGPFDKGATCTSSEDDLSDPQAVAALDDDEERDHEDDEASSEAGLEDD